MAAAAAAPQTSRSRTRQVRIREFLRRLEVSPCPFEVARVAARQQQAHSRHVHQQQSPSPSRSAGNLVSSASPARGFRQSRSLMDLIADSGGGGGGGGSGGEASTVTATAPAVPARPDPVPKRWLDKLMSHLPATAANAGHSEPCTICLAVPEKGEVVTTLQCCHWYHHDCIREWLAHSRLCPLCKGSAVPPGVSVPED
mmetsp:Transcript_61251/g.154606  ORF Transcript_61251/g.154606 Transcript_61251/m.154606 type:complete len:199 (-) Transcript_61251:78-674(-)